MGFLSKLFAPKTGTPPAPKKGFLESLFDWSKRRQAEPDKPAPFDLPELVAPSKPEPPRKPFWGPAKELPKPATSGTAWIEKAFTPSGGLELRPIEPEDVVYGGEWVLAASTNVERWRYLADEEQLEVEFKSGGYYRYYDVPVEVPFDFLVTPSPGRFVWNRLRDRFPYERLRSLETYKGKKPRKPTVIRRTLPGEKIRG